MENNGNRLLNNIYELSRKEVVKMHNEFNKTDYGRRAKFFSMVPYVLTIICLVGALIVDDSETRNVLIFGVAVSFVGLSIAQLQYGNMLKKYIESKK